jgi:hypothetical protein
VDHDRGPFDDLEQVIPRWLQVTVQGSAAASSLGVAGA